MCVSASRRPSRPQFRTQVPAAHPIFASPTLRRRTLTGK
jgi:hypothetical protein